MQKIPADLQIVLTLVVLTTVSVLTPPLNETPVRTVLGLATVLFLPGYALIAALFPRKKDLDHIERIALSFGLSIAVTPLLGLILNYSPYGITQTASLITLSLFTVICTLTAYVRRSNLDEKERFTPSFTYKPRLPEKKIDRILTIILTISILASVSAVIYVVVTPKEGEKFTEFYLLGPGGMADHYPTKLGVGENGSVTVGIVNHEHTQTNYLLEILLDNESIGQTPMQLEHNQSREYNVTFTSTRNGTQKLKFLLYREGLEEPYRTLHLWIKASSN